MPYIQMFVTGIVSWLEAHKGVPERINQIRPYLQELIAVAQEVLDTTPQVGAATGVPRVEVPNTGAIDGGTIPG